MQNTLQNIDTFVTKIMSTTKRLEKQEILTAYLNDIIIKNFLEFLYNPFKTTGISEKKWQKVLALVCRDTKDEVVVENNLDFVYTYLITHNTGRSEDLYELAKYVQCFPRYTELFRKLFTKNFQLGVDAKTLNNIYGESFIPDFGVQLANKYLEKKDTILGKEGIITVKIDGTRIILVKDGEQITCYNRSGIPLTGLVEIEKDLLESVPEESFVLDGELYATGEFSESKEGYKETIKRSRIKGNKSGLKIRAFDIMSVSEFKQRQTSTPFAQRRKNMEKLCEKLHLVEPVEKLFEGIILAESVDKIAQEQISKGEEGIMLNLSSSEYNFKRSNSLLKYKLFDDWDLEVVGFERGTNKNSDTLGAILVQFEDNIVKVGSGFSDIQRNEIWNNQDQYLGKTVTIKAFEVTSNQQGGKSLRFPTFEHFRDDK